jgi:hypothetical protein
MNDQPTDNPIQSEPLDPPEERRANRPGGWVGGTILIVVGIFLLLQNFGNFYLNNWWALFILIPAVGSFSTAWKAYQNAGGRLTNQVRGPLFGGVILTLVTAVFLFNLSWVIIGPVLLMLAGVGLLISSILPE